jgi:hypothetical protein
MIPWTMSEFAAATTCVGVSDVCRTEACEFGLALDDFWLL